MLNFYEKLNKNKLIDRKSTKYQDQLEAYESDIKKRWTNVQFENSLQKIFTPFSLVLEMLEKVRTLDNRDICVIANSEIYLLIKGLKEKGKENFQYKSLTLITDIKSLIGKENIKQVNFNNLNKLKLDMKFDVVLANPPYHQPAGDSTYSKPLQNYFVELGMKLGKKVCFITQANYCGPIKSSLKSTLANYKIEYFAYTDAFKKTVPNIEVAWFIVDTELPNNGLTTILNNKKEEFQYTIAADRPIPIFSSKSSVELVEKVKDLIGMDSIFTCNTQVLRSKLDYSKNGKYKVVQSTGNKAVPLIIESSNVTVKYSKYQLDNWKVVTPNVGSKGAIGNVKIAPPGVLLCKSCIGLVVESETEAKNCKKYLETDFVKEIVKSVKASTVNSKSVFKCIPILDFKKEWTEEELKNTLTSEKHN